MERAEIHILETVDWQFFGTFTFKSERLPERVRLALWFALLRTTSMWFRLYFPDLPWVLRQEKGEIADRKHFHGLIGGFPQHAVTPATCMSIKAQWEKLGGGMARVRVYDSARHGENYILDCLGGADVYESSKFLGSNELMISESVQRIAAARHWRYGVVSSANCRG